MKKGRNRKRTYVTIVLYAIFITIIFNIFALEIFNFNASVRSVIVNGEWDRRKFINGIPIDRSPRQEREFISPFYVVHYGLTYSESCRQVAPETSYHWIKDSTLKYWPQAPEQVSLEHFKASAQWLVEHAETDENGNTHFFYDFDWHYPKYPNGMLKAPWWSGLTDGYAIVLLLRAWDCFGEESYLALARDLYKSVMTPIENGGSLTYFNGHPWIEEYVDPSVRPERMSHVLNGMIYAYFGVRSYEEFISQKIWSDNLFKSIIENITYFDMGNWSYYDALGSEANLKYHGVNKGILEDRRIYTDAFDDILYRWNLGYMFPLVFYLLDGPASYAKYHFALSYLAVLIGGLGIVLALAKWRG